MDNKIKILRISYWVGAIADGLAVIPMLFPRIGGSLFGISNFDPSPYYRYAMFLGASLMLGWAFLLLWADRKPLERRGVLIITVFPVITGIFLSGVYAVMINVVKLGNIIPTSTLQIAISALFLFSYFYARTAPK
jgi:hypothetical protein